MSAAGPATGGAGDGSLRIAFITAGAAGMYCGTCLHDNAIAGRLIGLGHEVSLIPIYTPIRTDENDNSVGRVFYGAINVYLEQRSAVFRHTPWLVDRLLNSRRLLNWATKRGTSSVDARDLGELTLSVLQGEDGKQRKELERLIGWLRDSIRPQVVHLSNSMLLGLAPRLHEALGVPVVCSLQGEDIFLQDLDEPYRTNVRDMIAAKARHAAAFVSPSRYYAEHMAAYVGIPRDKICHVPLGVNPDGFTAAEPPATPPFVVGYLARICPEKGLHVLVDAFRRLADAVGRDAVRLDVAGYLGERDRAYHDGIVEQVRAWGLEDRVRFAGEVDRNGKVAFLQGLHVLSVPTTYREPKGLFVLEALACGVPVVLPEHGAFPEMVAETGGGVLVPPDDPAALASAWRALMDDPGCRAALGRAGRDHVLGRRTDTIDAEATVALYRRCLGQPATAELRERRSGGER